MTEIPIKREGDPRKEGSTFPAALRDRAKADAERLLKAPRWRKLAGNEIKREKGELRRTAKQLHLDYASLEQAFTNAQVESLSSGDWEAMTNTDSRGEWTKERVIAHIGSKRDHAKIFRGLENGKELPAPVVLFRADTPPYLIGGNTRLMACKALQIQPRVLAVRI